MQAIIALSFSIFDEILFFRSGESLQFLALRLTIELIVFRYAAAKFLFLPFLNYVIFELTDDVQLLAAISLFRSKSDYFEVELQDFLTKKIVTAWNDDINIGKVVFNHFFECSLHFISKIMEPLN